MDTTSLVKASCNDLIIQKQKHELDKQNICLLNECFRNNKSDGETFIIFSLT